MGFSNLFSESKRFILARLRLAQSILEESDFLDGCSAYDKDGEEWWSHPRHEREALVSYLLLTCFDRLGQEERFITFHDWLKSSKIKHSSVRNEVIGSLPSHASSLDSAIKLSEKYQEIYGVRNSFYRGLESLSESSRRSLVSSISISINKDYGRFGPDTSTPGLPLSDKIEEDRLRVKYLYERRNRFTHNLEQYHTSSVPLMSDGWGEGGSSWVVSIINSRMNYWCSHDDVKRGDDGAVIYTVSDWPFVLFEVLYDAIGVEFHRSRIRLKFKVLVGGDSDPGNVKIFDGIDHGLIESAESFLERFGE